MGCDIHAYVEKFTDGRWVWLRHDLFDHGGGIGVRQPGMPPPWKPFDRSYRLFGFLAGVRDHDVPQIHEVRGLPADLDPLLREEFGFTYPDDCPHTEEDRRSRHGCVCVYHHSGLFGHSWATGEELLAYDFMREFTCPYEHGPDRKYKHLDECVHWLAGTPKVTVGEYLGNWVYRFGEIAALAEDPNLVRVVYAFDN